MVRRSTQLYEGSESSLENSHLSCVSWKDGVVEIGRYDGVLIRLEVIILVYIGMVPDAGERGRES